MTRSLPAFALAALLAAPAAAQEGDPRPGFLDVVTLDTIAESFVNLGIFGLRNFIDIRYEHMSTDLLGGRASLAGVELRPVLPWDAASQCLVTIERVVADSTDIGQAITGGRGSLDLVGASMSSACLDPGSAQVARAMGLRELAIDHARLDLGYETTTGLISAQLTATVNGFGTLDGFATFAVGPQENLITGRWMDESFLVTEALVSFKDAGGWARVASLLPPEFQDPETIRLIGTEALTEVLGNGTPLSGTGRNFVASVMDEVVRFVSEPGEITLEADLPPEGVRLDESNTRSPMDLVTALALTARTAPSARATLLTAADLAALETGTLTPDQRIALARAFLTGDGVPRSPSLGFELLQPLIQDGDLSGEAAMLAALALSDGNPEEAYALALLASAEGQPGSAALLDRLERGLSSLVVLELQDELRDLDDPAAFVESLLQGDTDPRALRTAAIEALSGTGAMRDYAVAYFLATLAEGAGDAGATSVIEDLNSRFRNRGPEVAEAWADLAQEVSQDAVSTWFEMDLGARFKVE